MQTNDKNIYSVRLREQVEVAHLLAKGLVETEDRIGRLRHLEVEKLQVLDLAEQLRQRRVKVDAQQRQALAAAIESTIRVAQQQRLLKLVLRQ